MKLLFRTCVVVRIFEYLTILRFRVPVFRYSATLEGLLPVGLDDLLEGDPIEGRHLLVNKGVPCGSVECGPRLKLDPQSARR